MCLTDVDCNYREGNFVKAEGMCIMVAITLTISQLNMSENQLLLCKRGECGMVGG